MILGRVDESLHKLGGQSFGSSELPSYNWHDYHLQSRVVQILKSRHMRVDRELNQFRLKNNCVLCYGHHYNDEQDLLHKVTRTWTSATLKSRLIVFKGSRIHSLMLMINETHHTTATSRKSNRIMIMIRQKLTKNFVARIAGTSAQTLLLSIATVCSCCVLYSYRMLSALYLISFSCNSLVHHCTVYGVW